MIQEQMNAGLAPFIGRKPVLGTRRVNLSERLYEKNGDYFVNSSRAYPDCLTLTKLTRLSEPKKREEKRKVDPDRRLTLQA